MTKVKTTKRYKNNQTTKLNKKGGAGDKNIDKNTVLKTAYSQSNEIKSRTKLILLPYTNILLPVYFIGKQYILLE